MARKAISKKLRFKILERDGFCCVYCGAKPPDCVLHVDHKIPVSKGGNNDESNLVAACSDCNSGKGGDYSEDPFRLNYPYLEEEPTIDEWRLFANYINKMCSMGADFGWLIYETMQCETWGQAIDVVRYHVNDEIKVGRRFRRGGGNGAN